MEKLTIPVSNAWEILTAKPPRPPCRNHFFLARFAPLREVPWF
jgi:hypothetical protein